MSWTRTGVVRVLALFLCLSPAAANGADQILTPYGLGPVRIGMTVSQAEKALGAKFKPLDTSDGFSAESCWQTRRLDDPDPAVTYMVWYGKIVSIAIHLYNKEENWKTVPPFATAEGVRIGTDDAQVREAYGNSLSVRPHPQANDDKDDTMLVMIALTKNKRNGLAFETANKKVFKFRAGIPKAITLTEGCL